MNGGSVFGGPTDGCGGPGILSALTSLMRIPKRVDRSACSDAISIENDTNIANSDENSMAKDIVGVVHYKPSTNRQSQVQQHVHICQKETAATKADCQKEVAISS